MQRRNFITASLASALAVLLGDAEAKEIVNPVKGSVNARMPVLFVGHGSPMNAIQDNPFTRHLQQLGQTLPKPRAIVVVSAHWVRDSTLVMASPKPQTIHDFGGFPKALSDMQYPCPGHPALAAQIKQQLVPLQVGADMQWGLDHGAWTVLHHLYPKADIPVIQLSMNGHMTLTQHMQVGIMLRSLRQNGVLILGSGNIVHSLPMSADDINAKPYDWAVEFDALTKAALLQRNLDHLLAKDKRQYPLWQQAHPTIEHYLPLLYTLGASDELDKISFPFEGFQEAAFSMRSVRFG
ncbi:4,5-DOPA dioxygenase extradiol [Leeia oryzae]|uniref:4,5-DOPA-extradiol-dioxygenase n=1 Tax=Leeia oryzae TaxID=356662 RepID=UPI0003697DB4|nr:4,5-DOPA dioxygenase extradiol [Leeia oryzae]